MISWRSIFRSSRKSRVLEKPSHLWAPSEAHHCNTSYFRYFNNTTSSTNGYSFILEYYGSLGYHSRAFSSHNHRDPSVHPHFLLSTWQQYFNGEGQSLCTKVAAWLSPPSPPRLS